MTPDEFATKSILAQQNRSNSEFKDITHRGTTKKARIEYGDFRKINKSELNTHNIEDDISFLNVEMSFVARGDTIVFNGVTYYVDFFIPVMPGIVNIFATNQVETGSMLP